MKKKIKINDNKGKKIFIILFISFIIVIVSIFILNKIIEFKLSKEIVINQTVPSQEIQWLYDEYEGVVDIEEIIKKNIDKEIKVLIETKVVELEYETEYINKSSLPIGSIKVSQKGKDGKQEIIIKKEYKGDVLISNEQIGRRILTPTINKIIEVGIGSYSDVINNHYNDIEYSKEELMKTLNKNIPLNKPSGLTLEQFKKIFANESKDENGVFRENAEYFYYIEKVYGINGICVAAIGIHESDWGTSKIAVNKKNLFGYGAYDMNAYESAYSYNGYATGVDMIARVLVKDYLNPKGTIIYNEEIATGKYYNGNTLADVNKMYATDKNWTNSVYTWMKYLYNKI